MWRAYREPGPFFVYVWRSDEIAVLSDGLVCVAGLVFPQIHMVNGSLRGRVTVEVLHVLFWLLMAVRLGLGVLIVGAAPPPCRAARFSTYPCVDFVSLFSGSVLPRLMRLNASICYAVCGPRGLDRLGSS